MTILEVLTATTVLTVALAGLAQLFGVSTRANVSAKSTTYASLLAQQKMEQLRSLTWGFDPLGLPMTDTTTNITEVPESPVGGRGLSPSPAGALGQNTAGYCDLIDKNGVSLGDCSTPNTAASYVRRWSVDPLPTNPDNTIVLQVLVARNRSRGTADQATPSVKRLPDEARIVSVKTRKASS
jgi:hypothetical protein